MAKLLTITDPDTHVAYYRRNRKDLYTVTVSREGLQGAFVSWDRFEQYISSLVNHYIMVIILMNLNILNN